ncbi:hypothetical protein [Natronosalvus amylolyticus]|uniref:hypothetical protein n=1 Tax=Natronosalvus amylolyticus TaxID=2961994 RepID=UPI0020C998AC|nr:hypothetical protein [Natronosalvus amylolyticus]
MPLKATIEHNGVDYEIDLDELTNYGDYYLTRGRDLIIRAEVFTTGTKNSRHIRDPVEVGTDYEIVPVVVDRPNVRQQIHAKLGIDIYDEELNRIVEAYEKAGCEVLESWTSELDGDRILGKERQGILSTDIDDPLTGWENDFAPVVDQVAWEHEEMTRQEIVSVLTQVSPGLHEFSAKVELRKTPEVTSILRGSEVRTSDA